MVGRAGRPQYDVLGTAVIMTDRANVDTWNSLAQGDEILESRVLHRFCDMINSEIASGLICDVGSLILWAQGLYFFGRFIQDPSYAGGVRNS